MVHAQQTGNLMGGEGGGVCCGRGTTGTILLFTTFPWCKPIPISEYFIFLKYFVMSMCKILACTIIIMGYMRGPSLRRIQDFPGSYTTPKGGGGHQHIVWPNFAVNCMKMKIGPRGSIQNLYYVNPPLLQARRIVCLTHTELGLSSM